MLSLPRLKIPSPKTGFFFVYSLIAIATMSLLGIGLYVASRTPQSVKTIQSAGVQSNIIPAGVYLQLKGDQASINSQSDTTMTNQSKSLGVPTTNTSQTSTNANPSAMIGIYESSAPSNPQSLTRLEDIRQAGFNTVLNYDILDGSKSDILRYLDKAQSLGLHVLFSIKDFYDNQSNPDVHLSDFSEYGNTNTQIVTGIIQAYKSHPALYGWYISDEQPEVPANIDQWASVLQDRYRLIKQQDPAHPTLMILSCYQGSNIAAWPKALKQLSQSTDGLGFDSYPIPYAPISIVGQCAQLTASTVINPANRWFVVQGFSWSAYPDVVAGDNQDITQARYPTISEMETMINSAKQAGVPNILIYSYFDLKNDQANFANTWLNLKQALQNTQ